MNHHSGQPGNSVRPHPPDGGRSPAVRFDAAVRPGARNRDLDRVADLDLDRVPGPGDEVRLLVTQDDLTRLLEHGYEVHLYEVAPVAPFPAELVYGDDSAAAWLEERVRGIERAGGS